MLLPDSDARDKALDPRQSFIVQAPAGSGKTELLTQRYLVLLTTVNQPEEILAITFTKKSAHEMRSRIINTLNYAADTSNEPELMHAKKTWYLAKKVLQRDKELEWHLLDNPNRLRIQTIDSFNVGLTKHLPILSQFGASPEITDRQLQLYQAATRDILSYIDEDTPWSHAFSQLLLHMDNNPDKLQTLLIAMLTKRDQWKEHVIANANDPHLRVDLEQSLSHIITDTLSHLCNVFPKAHSDELLTLIRYAASNLLNLQSPSIITACDHLTALPGNQVNDLPYWLGIAELLLTKEGEWRKKPTITVGFPAIKSPPFYKERIIQLIDTLSTKEELRHALDEVRSLPDEHYTENQWQLLQALNTVLYVTLAELRVVFQKTGKIDYIENAIAALLALGSEDAPTDIALALDYRIKHILVDEFQDTANLQYQLLKKITAGWQQDDGRTLFLVGDPMQSIYRFREAEVGLFIHARQQGLGHIRLQPLTLSVNFRSTNKIVNWINDTFKIVLPPFENIALGAVSYSQSIANSVDEPRESGVEVHAFSQDNAFHQQANKIITLIEDAKKTNPEGSIAILVRTRSHLKAIIPALKKAKEAYRAIKIDPLSLRPVIQDLMALTRALLYAMDRIAWLAVLRAPWCGLTLSDILLLTGSDRNISLWQRLQFSGVISTLSDDGQKRLARILPILNDKIAERQRQPLRAWIESTWILIGGPASCEQESDLHDASAYFSLLEQLDSGATLTTIDMLYDSVRQLFASADHNAFDRLQIMTIHNAKGLEFDTVILPHLEKRSASDDKQLLLWLERTRSDNQRDLLIAPIHGSGESSHSIYDYIKRQHKIKFSYEEGRLLYVAATRAKKKLHLLFSIDSNQQKKQSDIKPPANTLLEKLWPAIQSSLDLSNLKTTIDSTLPDNAEKSIIKRLPCDWVNPVKQEFITGIAYHQKDNGFLPKNNKPKLIGIFMHQFLQKVSLHGLSWWNDQSDITQQHYIKTQLIQGGLSKNDLQSAMDAIYKGIHHIHQDDKAAWILAPHREAHSEYAITALINNEIKSLIIDRTFIDDKGVRWIIDYKTSILTSDDLDNFLNHEQEKYKKQLWQYHSAFRQSENIPLFVGLYFPMIPAWREWSFELPSYSI